MAVNEHGPDEANTCAGCGVVTAETRQCHICRMSADMSRDMGLGTREVPDLCSECRNKCTNCGQPMCDEHERAGQCNDCYYGRATND